MSATHQDSFLKAAHPEPIVHSDLSRRSYSLFEVQERVRKIWGRDWKPKVIVPISAHYSWQKAISFMGLGDSSMIKIPLDLQGRMDVSELKKCIAHEMESGSTIVAVVSLAGSTEMGTVDSIDEIQEVLDSFYKELGVRIWHHVDAAYGGFFSCCASATLTPDFFTGFRKGVRRVQSLTIDPHKLGYVPYAAGVILVREASDYELLNVGAPYLEADKGWPGAQTLEGSRAATGATAFWLMAKSLGLNEDGLGRLLGRTVKLRQTFQGLLKTDSRILVLPGCHSNLCLFSMGTQQKGESRKLSELNACVESLMRASQNGELNYKISMTTFDLSQHLWLRQYLERESVEVDVNQLMALRIVFMNPFIESKESRVKHTEALYLELIQKL